MRSAKSIMFRKKFVLPVICSALLLASAAAFAQDNSPYSRYGLGDQVPQVNSVNRGMGNISAGFADPLSVNFNNPASYSAFRVFVEEKSKRPVSGRVVLDAGINIDSRTLRSPNQTDKFTSNYASFSYIHLGVPLKNNWGLSFGLRPLTRVGYKISRRELLNDPQTGKPIDSAFTEFSGDGGAFLPSIGTGFGIKNLSLGVSMGYLFGKKEFSTRRHLFGDSALYHSSNHTTRTSYGDIFFNAGAQYKIKLNKQTFVRLGVAGNWKQDINASQDVLRETFVTNPVSGNVRQDSIFEKNSESGEIIYPASYTMGFVIENTKEKGNGWMLGADLVQSKWSDYRFFKAIDSVKNNWQLRVGGQFRPEPSRAYFTNVAYRAGFFIGPDYINVGNELPQFGVTFGMGLPIANYNRLSPGQFTVINLGLEYARRGNNDNQLKENLFRVTLGLNFSDLWFSKRRYD